MKSPFPAFGLLIDDGWTAMDVYNGSADPMMHIWMQADSGGHTHPNEDATFNPLRAP